MQGSRRLETTVRAAQFFTLRHSLSFGCLWLSLRSHSFSVHSLWHPEASATDTLFHVEKLSSPEPDNSQPKIVLSFEFQANVTGLGWVYSVGAVFSSIKDGLGKGSGRFYNM